MGFVEGPGLWAVLAGTSIFAHILLLRGVESALLVPPLILETVDSASLWEKLWSLIPIFLSAGAVEGGSYFFPPDCPLDTANISQEEELGLTLGNVCKVCFKKMRAPPILSISCFWDWCLFSLLPCFLHILWRSFQTPRSLTISQSIKHHPLKSVTGFRDRL